MHDIGLHAFDEEAPAAGRLGAALGLTPEFVRRRRFPDGELLLAVPQTSARQIVYRSLNQPDEKLVELILAAEAWRREGARELILVAPYLCYMRQDAVFAPGQAVSQKSIGRLLGGLFDHILTVDAHLHRTPRLDDVLAPARGLNLSSSDAIAAALKSEGENGALLVGPDIESLPWVRSTAGKLGADYAVFTKKRMGDTHVELEAPSDVRLSGRRVVIIDDICSSGGTILAMLDALRALGAQSMRIIVTHALCPQDTVRAFGEHGAESFVSCDSVAHQSNAIPLSGVLATGVREVLQI